MKSLGQFKGSALAAAFLLLLLSGCERMGPGPQAAGTGTPEAAMEAAESAPPATAVPRRGTTILAEGQLVAQNPQLSLSFATNGRLLELHVAAGERVAAGDLIATLDDEALQEALANGRLGVRQAENSLAQAGLALQELRDWQADETAVAQARASLAAAEAGLENAQSQDSAAGYSVTAAKVQLEQAQQALVDAQEAYETAFDPGRDWEQFIDDPSCRTGEQFPNCTGPPYSDVIKNEREAAERFVPNAEDQLRVAQANYNLALAGLNDDSAVSAEANIAAARQALDQALRGPKEAEIAAARLQEEQAQLALEQAQISLANAEKALADARLTAPWAGTILSVDSAPGSLIGAGTPVVTLLDTENVRLHTSNLSERDLAQIAPGRPAVITLKSYPGTPLEGRVLRVAPVAEGTIGDAATFTVIIEIGETTLELLPGMTGRVEITGAS